MPSVAVGFCHSQDNLTPQFARSLRSVYLLDSRERETPWIVDEFDVESSGALIPEARCGIVRAFLNHPDQPEWLWMVDADATFGSLILDHLIAVADADERPIVGALAFAVTAKSDEYGILFNDEWAVESVLTPTLYAFDDQGQKYAHFDYPANALVQVGATGCHCFIVHRRVLADPRWDDGHSLPWFRFTYDKGQKYSEDLFFFTKAGAFGYPTHVHTGIKTGHVKTMVADEEMYLRLRSSS